MKRASDHRRTAREALKGNRIKAFIALLFFSMMSGAFYSSSVQLQHQGNVPSFGENIWLSLPLGYTIPLSFSGMLLHLFLLLLFLGLTPAARLGYTRFGLNLIDRKEAKASQVFSGYARFWKALGTGLLISLRLAGWSILFIAPPAALAFMLPFYIPGIILYAIALAIGVAFTYISFGYMFAFHVLADQPDLSCSQAISESVRLMSGNRWRLLCLDLSFTGWRLPPFLFALLLELPPFFPMLLNPVLFQALSIIVLLFDLLYNCLFLTPYMDTAYCSFYRELTALPADTKEQEMPEIHAEEDPSK